MLLRPTILALSLVSLAGCDNRTSGLGGSYTERFDRLEQLVVQTSIGPNGDYWLVQSTRLGSDPLALIFGYPNNLGFCQELVDAQKQLYPAMSFTCEPAQK